MKKVVLSVVLLSSFVFGEDMDNIDDFDSAFDDVVVPVKKEKKSYSFSLNGSLKLRGYGFIKPTDYEGINNSRAQMDSILELNSKLKKDNYLFNLSIFGMIGTEHNSYNYKEIMHEFRDINKEVPMGGIRESYLLRTSDNYDIVVGKKIFKTGISTLYSPSDVYNVTLSPDPLDPYTTGTWLTDFEYYLNSASYGIVFFPFISNSKTFSSKSRWSGNDSETSNNTNNFIVPEGTTIIQDRENKVRALFRFKNNTILFKHGIDWMIDVGYGPSLYSVLEYTNKSATYLETRPEAWYVDFGFSTTYKKLEVHSEVYYQNAFSDRDDDFISAVGGATYTLDQWIDKIGLDKVNMTVEYVKEIVVDSYDSNKTFRSSEKERAPKNDILIKADAEINDKWSLNYFANFRLSIKQNRDSGRYQKFGTTYKISDGFVGELFVEVFNGDVNSYYGKWRDNDRIGIQTKYSF